MFVACVKKSPSQSSKRIRIREYDDGDDNAHHFSEEQHSALVLVDEQRESKECATKKNKEKKKSAHPIIFFTERNGFVHLNNKRRKEREIWRRVYDAHSF